MLRVVLVLSEEVFGRAVEVQVVALARRRRRHALLGRSRRRRRGRLFAVALLRRLSHARHERPVRVDRSGGRRPMSRRCRAPRDRLSTVPSCLRHKRGPESTGERGPAGVLVKKRRSDSQRGDLTFQIAGRRRSARIEEAGSRLSSASLAYVCGVGCPCARQKSAQIRRICSC